MSRRARSPCPTGTVAPLPARGLRPHCLLKGVDELGYLLAREPEIDAYERRA